MHLLHVVDFSILKKTCFMIFIVAWHACATELNNCCQALEKLPQIILNLLVIRIWGEFLLHVCHVLVDRCIY